MPEIKYVCLSDMHLGDRCSLLTNMAKDFNPDLTKPSPVLKNLAECLRYLIEESKESEPRSHLEEKNTWPKLILNGDILDLALAMDNQSATAFLRFIELVMPKDKEFLSEIFYIPGNHDHHLWESARESKYADYILKQKEPLPLPWHSTRMFVVKKPQEIPPTSPLLESLFKLHNLHKGPTVVYPNFGLLNENKRKCVVFHHGHFVEKLYHFTSTLRDLIFPLRKKPVHTWNLEEENFAWIDFIWSTLGRSGSAGKDFGLVYHVVKDYRRIKKLLFGCLDRLRGYFPSPWWIIARPLLRWVCPYLLEKLIHPEKLLAPERSRGATHSGDALSEDGKQGLKWYMEGPLKEQLLIELKEAGIPSDVTFVFGHTHKPFEAEIVSDEYPPGVKVYNNGGWVVDTVKSEPLHGGTIILIDQNLDVCSVRMYNEEPRSVYVKEARPPGGQFGPFAQKISGLIGKQGSPFDKFLQEVKPEIRLRTDYLKQRIDSAEGANGWLRYR